MRKRSLWITVLMIFFSFCLTLGLVACSDNKDNDGLGGNGNNNTNTEQVVFNEVTTVDELLTLNNSAENYKLKNDIDISSVSNWTPIADFSGIFDGAGFSIQNLTITSVEKNIGLFGVLQGTIENLKIENAQITARGDAGNAGIVAGLNKGTISSVTVNGNISPEYYDNVGGLVGYNDCGAILNCVNQATVTGANNVGGIVGNISVNKNDAIIDCSNEGIVTGKDNVGGIAGYLTMPSRESFPTYTVSNNQNKNSITGTNCVGGVFGEVYGMYWENPHWSMSDAYGYFEISNLTNQGTITGSAIGNNTGGLIGKATRLKSLKICENTGDVLGGNYVGGFIGNAPDTNIKATGSENNSTITGKGKIGGFAGQAGIIENAINNGDVISIGVIVENGNSQAYVGGIAGYCVGVVGCVNNADIKVETEGNFVGGIAGYVSLTANNTANDNINNGEIVGKDKVGGIAGYLNGSFNVSNNKNSNIVTGINQIGGIFGEVGGSIEMSLLLNTADIFGGAIGNDVGGLIGRATQLKMLTTCENQANVSGCNYVGGFVGYAPNVKIKATGAENNNIITGKCYIGGFAGQAGIIENAVNNGEIVSLGPDEEGNTYLGGIAGYCTGVIACVNNADISVANAGNYIGGITGYIKVSTNNMVNDNINNGAVWGKDNVGGIAGYLTSPSKDGDITYIVSNNQNKNIVNGVNKVGGIFGEVFGMHYKSPYWSEPDHYGYFEVINCRNEAEIEGTTFIGGIIGAYTRLKTDDTIMNTNITLYGEKLGQ